MITLVFSGSKGGTGKTTLAVSLAIVSSSVASTLLVDASAEGGATAYLLGDVPPPYLREDPPSSVRRVEGDTLNLFVAVNRGPLANSYLIAESVRKWSQEFMLVIIDLPALTDSDAVDRYLPLILESHSILIVTEPNPASMESALYTFSGKRLVVALNCPRPYPKSVVEHYSKVVASFCKRVNADYVTVPYEPAVSRLSPSTLRVLDYTGSEYDAAIAKLVNLLLRSK